MLIVSAPTSFGIPAPIAAWRAGAWPTPAWSTSPMITYSTSPASSPARSSAALIAIAPSSGALYAPRPPPSLPNGVRAVETITDRAIGQSLTVEPSPAEAARTCPEGRLHLAVARLDEGEERVGEEADSGRPEQEVPVRLVRELGQRPVEADRLLRVELPGGPHQEEPGEQEDDAPGVVPDDSKRRCTSGAPRRPSAAPSGSCGTSVRTRGRRCTRRRPARRARQPRRATGRAGNRGPWLLRRPLSCPPRRRSSHR